MKMAIRLNEFAEGLDDKITILDLKPRITTEGIEHPPVERQGDSLYQKFLDPIDAWGSRGQFCARGSAVASPLGVG